MQPLLKCYMEGTKLVEICISTGILPRLSSIIRIVVDCAPILWCRRRLLLCFWDNHLTAK